MAQRPSRPQARLFATLLEDRVNPVLASFNPAPIIEAGNGYDGVVQLNTADATGTGALLWTGRHILTAAHVVTNSRGEASEPVTVSFDLPVLGRVSVIVPAANINIPDDFNPTTLMNDIAVLELPSFAPSSADRYDISRTGDEVGKAFTIVGYGRVGTGTTGELPNGDNVKHIAANRYDTLGDRLNLGRGQTLLYDFDNATSTNDAFGRIFGLRDLGLKEEGSAGRGDSGAATFAGIGGKQTILGITSSSLNATNPANPALLNSTVRAGFGSISLDTRVAFHSKWIDNVVAGKASIAIDLRTQPEGSDTTPDTVEISVSDDSLKITINEEVFDLVPLDHVGTLAITGAGEQAAPFPTAVNIAADVPAWLAITLERMGTVSDVRPVRVFDPRDETLIEVPNPDSTIDSPIYIPSPTPDAEPLPEPEPQPTTDRESDDRVQTTVTIADIANAISVKTITAIGAGAGGGPRVRVIDNDTDATLIDFFPFEPTFTGGVQTSIADVNGDLIPDLITAAGVGGAPRVAIYDGVTWKVIFDEFVFESELRGGVTVAAGDVNNDGIAELIVGAGVGGAPRVRVLDMNTGDAIHDFFAFDSAERGGVSIAVGDINNDGTADLILGAGVGSEPVVRVLDGTNPENEIRSFSPYAREYTGGISVAVGDLNGDNRVDIVTSPANGGGPHVRVYEGRDGVELYSYFAFPTDSTTGVRVGISDLDGDGLGEIIAGEGPGGGRIRTFAGTTGVELETITPFDDSFNGGVYVG